MLQLFKGVNASTGEIVSEKQWYIEDVLNEDGYKVPTHKKRAAMFADVRFPAEMTDTEIGKMARLSKLMISTSNMLGYKKGRCILPYTEKHIIDILDLSQYRGKEFIQKMIFIGVMQKTVRKIMTMETEEYYINPAYFFAGKRISLNLYLLFREHLNAVLPNWVIAEFLNMAKEQDCGGVHANKKAEGVS